MVDDRERPHDERYNPIEFIQLPPFTKEDIKREAIKVLASESAILRAATLARNIGNATVTLEPEMKALAGGLAFIAKDVGNLFADFLILVSKALDASHRDAPRKTPAESEHGT
jgi:hypothetical protein